MSSTSTPVTDREPDGARGRAGVDARRDLQAAVLRVALGPVLAGLAASAFLLLVVVALAPDSHLTTSRVARAAGAAWLAAHQVQIEIQGAPLGVLPLMPTLGLAVLVARTAQRAAERCAMDQPADAALLAVATAGGHAVIGCLVAVWISTPGHPDVEASPVRAALGCGLVTGVAVLAGLARPCGLVDATLERAPRWVGPAVAAGARGAAVLATAGLGALLVALVCGAETVRDLFASNAPEAGSAAGLGLLSVAYLPNAGIWALAWLAGPGVTLGGLASNPFDTTGSGVPPVPLLGALPLGAPQSWWPLAVLVPVAAGVLLGRRVLAVDGLVDRLRAVAAGAALAGIGCGTAAWLAGGRLGSGAYDPVEVHEGSVGLAAAGWFLLGALPVVLLAGRSLRGALAVRVPGPRRTPEVATPDDDPIADVLAEARSMRYGALAEEAGGDDGTERADMADFSDGNSDVRNFSTEEPEH